MKLHDTVLCVCVCVCVYSEGPLREEGEFEPVNVDSEGVCVIKPGSQ